MLEWGLDRKFGRGLVVEEVRTLYTYLTVLKALPECQLGKGIPQSSPHSSLACASNKGALVRCYASFEAAIRHQVRLSGYGGTRLA